MNTNRDNFSADTKRILASRVAYRCCYAGCSAITIGPNTTDDQKIVNLGEAAHIHAAAPGGPRYHPDMTAEQRKSIHNGIWMCRKHARLIDANEGNYAAETLLQWKQAAEAESYRQLKGKHMQPDPTTIICLRHDLMFEGVWKAAIADKWTFIVKSFIYGSLNDLREFNTQVSSPLGHYILIESQGDGRLINQQIHWKQKEGGLEVSVRVFPPVLRSDPNKIGSDLAAGFNGDLLFADGDLKMVSGKALAKQIIENSLSLHLGSWRIRPNVGSLFTKYYHAHKENKALLNRLIKVEITRMITIPNDPDCSSDQPELNFINRIHEVTVLEELHGIVPVHVVLEWGDGSYGNDTFHVQLHPINEEIEFDELPTLLKEMIQPEPLNQMRKLTARLNQEEMRQGKSPEVTLELFKELLPQIMSSAEAALTAEIYPRFQTNEFSRTFDDCSTGYGTSYDLEKILYQQGSVRRIGISIRLNGYRKAGINAFDVQTELNVFLNEYSYTIAEFEFKPWLTKMYHQMPSSEEIVRLADYFINDVVKKINQKILSL